MTPTATLGIESNPVITPIPLIFHVLVDGKTVALLEYETVKTELARFDAMKAAYDRAHGGGGSGGGGMAGINGLTLGASGGGAGGDYIKPQRMDTDELPYMVYAPTAAQGAGSGGGGGAGGGAMEWPLKHTVVKPTE